MIHTELISPQDLAKDEKSATFPADRGDNPSSTAASNLAVRLRMVDELIERGLSKQAAARLMRLDPN